jgi:hypothetical protein
MTQSITNDVQRELFMTPEVVWFLDKCEKTKNDNILVNDICRALNCRDKKDGCIRLSACPTVLIYIYEPAQPGGPDRVLVWHGPTNGAFFKESFFERAMPYGLSLV